MQRTRRVAMPMDAVEFNQIVADYGADLQAISDTLHSAAKGRLTGEAKSGAIATAKAKIAAYNLLLNDDRLTALRRSQVADTYGESFEWLQETLDRLA